jgi:flagellar basal body-associated protein FliL
MEKKKKMMIMIMMMMMMVMMIKNNAGSFCFASYNNQVPLPEEEEGEEGECHQSLSEEKEDFNPVWISQNLN